MIVIAFVLGLLASAALGTAKSPGSRQSAAAVIESLQGPVRLILTDLDGTLNVSKREGILSENVDAFSLAQKLGIAVGVATGRSPRRARSFLGEENMRSINFPGFPGVYLNGCTVFDNEGRLLKDERFQPELVDEIVRVVEAEGMLIYLSIINHGGIIDSKDFKSSESKMDLYKDIYQIRFASTPDVAVVMRAKLEKHFGARVRFSWTADGYIEMAPPGCSKGAGVELIASSMGIPLENVLVMGDGENDVTMFGVAGAAIAVERACQHALNAADGVGADSADGALNRVVALIERYHKFPKYLEELKD